MKRRRGRPASGEERAPKVFGVRAMLVLSLLLNLAVLTPVCWGLLSNAAWASQSYGGATPARGILLSVYLAIWLVSLALLVAHREPGPVAALLMVQVVYKVSTPFTVGTLQNPVVLSNLAIAAFHAVTLVCIHRARA